MFRPTDIAVTRRRVVWLLGLTLVATWEDLSAVNALLGPETLQAIRDDYRSGRVEIVRGWIVSKTEAELSGS